MDETGVLKALADETRYKIVKLLLSRNYCVRALSRKLGVTEAAVSQHLKVLKNVKVVTGEKRGYFVHYSVDRDVIARLSRQLMDITAIESLPCRPEHGGCCTGEASNCHNLREDD